jgi:hypothetical protein
MKAPRKRSILTAACVVATVVGVAGAALLVMNRDTTPDPPDVTAMDLREAMKFEASADYEKMSVAKRAAFSEAVLEKLHAMPFEEMLRIALDPSSMEMQRKRLGNLRKLPNYAEIHSKYAAQFLEKFYELPAMKRGVYLTALALYMEAESRLDPGRYKTPSPGDFHKDAVKLFAGQSPTMKAYAMQFMIDLRQQRNKLGLKDLPLPMN